MMAQVFNNHYLQTHQICMDFSSVSQNIFTWILTDWIGKPVYQLGMEASGLDDFTGSQFVSVMDSLDTCLVRNINIRLSTIILAFLYSWKEGKQVTLQPVIKVYWAKLNKLLPSVVWCQAYLGLGVIQTI